LKILTCFAAVMRDACLPCSRGQIPLLPVVLSAPENRQLPLFFIWRII
jgi:hypothetical protein